MTAPSIRLLLAAVALLAAWFDLRYRRIPNWLTGAAFLAGLCANVVDSGWAGLRLSLLGAGLAALVYLPLYLIRAVGGGDLKLMLAVGALAGPRHWLTIFVLTALAGGMVAIIIVLAKGRLRRTLANVAAILRHAARLEAPYQNPELDVRSDKGVRLPHGAVIAGAIALFLAFLR